MVLYNSSKKSRRNNFEMPRYSTVHTSNEALLTGVALFFFSLSVNTISTDLCMCETEPDLTIPANRRLEFESQQQQQQQQNG